MKWQAITGVTQQLSDEAKIVLKHKLEKDAAVQIPDLWSDFLLGTTKHLQDSQPYIEVTTSGKTGGLACKTQFDPAHSDFLDNDTPFSDYIMNRYDQRAAAHLAKATNPITRKFLQHKIGEYKPQLASQIARLEAQLVDGKRHNMAIDATEKLKIATYDNPQTYSSNLQDAVTALSSLSLLPLEKERLINNAKTELAEAAALGIINQSPQIILDKNSNAPWKADLSLNQRLKIEHGAASKLKQDQLLVQHQVQALSHSHFASILETGKGVTGFENLLEASFAPKDPRRQQIKAKEHQYLQAFALSQELKFAPFDQAANVLSRIAPKSGEQDYSQKQELYHILLKQFEQQVKLAKYDPAKLVESLFSDQLPSELPLTQRLLLRKQLQDQKAIPTYGQKYLMKAEQEQYLRKLESEDINEVKQQIDSIIAIGKEQYQIGLEVLHELLKMKMIFKFPSIFTLKTASLTVMLQAILRP